MKPKKPVFRDLVIILHNPEYSTEVNIVGQIQECYRGSWGEERFQIKYVNYNNGYTQHRMGCFGLSDLRKVTKQSLLNLSRFHKHLSTKYEKIAEKEIGK